ncbi:hypothetical protein [Pontiella desulfatans]|uniref:hypothetical protein n=1 Tax=Pontiella desulfatans TaxID=2750659 RepID=UPI00109D6B70|nr:hypothetical protein [Pontiella desulfatans]
MCGKYISLVSSLIISQVICSCSTSTAIKPTVAIQTESSRTAGFYNVTASREPDGLRITGKLHRKSFPKSQSTGHVDVHILDGSGKTLQIVHVKPTPGMFFRRSVVKPRFSALVPVEPGSELTVEVKHHAASISVHKPNGFDAT